MEYKADLKNLPIGKIKKNPENPRIFFREEEMDKLYISIKAKGLLVPISVYEDKGEFYIIDGERRWRTFIKRNYETIPAIIQDKPTELENLLLMFNIHGLREQWDIYTIAMKIERVFNLLADKLKRDPTELELSEETGMTRGVIRRCKMIISLPDKFKTLLGEELIKPKKEQRFREDFFLEMENSLKTVNNNFPETIAEVDNVRDVLIEKYLDKTINNVTDFRKLTKIATAWKNINYSADETVKVLNLLFTRNHIGISDVYEQTFSSLYGDRVFNNNAKNFLLKLESIEINDIDKQLREMLLMIKEKINSLI